MLWFSGFLFPEREQHHADGEQRHAGGLQTVRVNMAVPVVLAGTQLLNGGAHV